MVGMPKCPKCRCSFRVMADEDDGQHGCPSCGYGDDPPLYCEYCIRVVDPDTTDMQYAPFCSVVCAINAEAEEMENV